MNPSIGRVVHFTESHYDFQTKVHAPVVRAAIITALRPTENVVDLYVLRPWEDGNRHVAHIGLIPEFLKAGTEDAIDFWSWPEVIEP